MSPGVAGSGDKASRRQWSHKTGAALQEREAHVSSPASAPTREDLARSPAIGKPRREPSPEPAAPAPRGGAPACRATRSQGLCCTRSGRFLAGSPSWLARACTSFLSLAAQNSGTCPGRFLECSTDLRLSSRTSSQAPGLPEAQAALLASADCWAPPAPGVHLPGSPPVSLCYATRCARSGDSHSRFVWFRDCLHEAKCPRPHPSGSQQASHVPSLSPTHKAETGSEAHCVERARPQPNPGGAEDTPPRSGCPQPSLKGRRYFDFRRGLPGHPSFPAIENCSEPSHPCLPGENHVWGSLVAQRFGACLRPRP